MTNPLVSIVIPVYNQAQTIASSIQSAIVASSQYPESEIVVCDNHSTDGTSQVVQSFSNHIKIVALPVISRWQKIELCSQEFFKPMDSSSKW